jgi:pilus assembly protein CpaC
MLPTSRLIASFPFPRRLAGFVLLLALTSAPSLVVAQPLSRPAAVEQIQCKITVIEMRPGLARNFAFPFLQHNGQVLTEGQDLRQPFAGVLGSPNEKETFMAFLQALKAEGLAKVGAEPNLITLSGKPASFLLGGQQAVPVPSGSGQRAVEFVDIGTKLNLLPKVVGAGKVRLEAEAAVSSLVGDAGQQTTQRMSLLAELKDGETLLIGGIHRLPEAAKVGPVLSKRPIVEAASRMASSSSRDDSELVILVTPSVVHPADCGSEIAPEPSKVPMVYQLAEPAQPSTVSSGGRLEPARKGAEDRLQALERRLKRLQEEIGDLHEEIRTLRSSQPAAEHP